MKSSSIIPLHPEHAATLPYKVSATFLTLSAKNPVFGPACVSISTILLKCAATHIPVLIMTRQTAMQDRSSCNVHLRHRWCVHSLSFSWLMGLAEQQAEVLNSAWSLLTPALCQPHKHIISMATFQLNLHQTVQIFFPNSTSFEREHLVINDNEPTHSEVTCNWYRATYTSNIY